MLSPLEPVGIIAGNRSLPLLFAQQARKEGARRLVAVAFDGETNPALAQLVDDITWLRVGQLTKMINVFKERGVRHCVMLGQIAPKNLFQTRPDFRAVSALLKLKAKNAHTIFGAVADELKKDGIELIEATAWLEPLMPKKGFALGPKLSDEQRDDLEFGFRIAKETSRLEIGQTVVVKSGSVLAVEAFEGTDECLRRGGKLASGDGAVAVKVAKDKHDMRFDIPCIGAGTIEVCKQAGIGVLGIEGGKTLLLEQDEMETLVKRHRVSVVAC